MRPNLAKAIDGGLALVVTLMVVPAEPARAL